MKLAACLLLTILTIEVAVEARELQQVVRKSIALSTRDAPRKTVPSPTPTKKNRKGKTSGKKIEMATASGAAGTKSAAKKSDGTVEAVVSTEGCGVKTTISAFARSGEDASVERHVSRVGCGEIKDSGLIKGTNNRSNKFRKGSFKSSKNKDEQGIDLSSFVAKIQKGENAEDVAVELIKTFEKFENKLVAEALLRLADDGTTFDLFYACVEIFFESKGCEAFKLLIKGYEKVFILYQLPFDVIKCVYTSCSMYPGTSLCCNENELSKDHCYCKDGKCRWFHPLNLRSSIPFWICEDCGFDIPACTCD